MGVPSARSAIALDRHDLHPVVVLILEAPLAVRIAFGPDQVDRSASRARPPPRRSAQRLSRHGAQIAHLRRLLILWNAADSRNAHTVWHARVATRIRVEATTGAGVGSLKPRKRTTRTRRPSSSCCAVHLPARSDFANSLGTQGNRHVHPRMEEDVTPTCQDAKMTTCGKRSPGRVLRET
jgi:hypothetical protein